MNNNVHFSSHSSEWSTPQALFDQLDQIYHFTLDVCATPENAKCPCFFTKEQDGLTQNWTPHVCWMNPPYGREIRDWVANAALEAYRGATVVALLPARTDTRWFHEYIYNESNVTIEFLKGRLKFGGAKNSAPFPSMIVVFS